MKKEKIEAFYDDFSSSQQSTGVNERIYSLYNRLLQAGLKKNSHVLELGCGIGVLTHLLSKKIKSGQIESVDLSSKSIELAKQKTKQEHIQFFAHDVVTYKAKNKGADFITLFDILEHIPMEQHQELFNNISEYATEETNILINIPNPAYLEYDHKYQAEVLQVIDQPLPLEFMNRTITNSGLEIVFFELYSIFFKEDYQFFMVRKKREFKEVKLSDQRNFKERIENKWSRIKMNLLYKY